MAILSKLQLYFARRTAVLHSMTDKVAMSETNEKPIKPFFLRMASGFLLCSIVSQVYFFTIINDILDKEFSAMGVISGIIEWIYLVGPSFFFAIVFFGMSVFCTAVSYFRKEGSLATKIVFGLALVDLIVFCGITTFVYG